MATPRKKSIREMADTPVAPDAVILPKDATNGNSNLKLADLVDRQIKEACDEMERQGLEHGLIVLAKIMNDKQFDPHARAKAADYFCRWTIGIEKQRVQVTNNDGGTINVQVLNKV